MSTAEQMARLEALRASAIEFARAQVRENPKRAQDVWRWLEQWLGEQDTLMDLLMWRRR